ncbi:MAG: hypothetical protein J6S40_04765, partial [Thermoguttaceae bacterium]|nr:hypothetical protein [Thermoguttaceae bacterium]
MRNVFSPRKLRLESLEERTLLAVMAGGIERASQLAAPTEASTWLVNTTDDPTSWYTSDNILSLREAIDIAAEGDTILFDASLSGQMIVLAGGELTVDKGISIDATDIGGITIDANGQSRVFCVSGGDETSPVELIGLTITGGNNSYGGGIYNDGTLTITNSTISGNTASYDGGGIYNIATLTLTNTIISLNYAGNFNDVYGSYSGSNNIVGDDPGFVVDPVFD